MPEHEKITYLVTSDYTCACPEPLTESAGTTLTRHQRETEWPGWVWCTAPGGGAGWVPLAWLEPGEHETCTLRRDYTARELAIVSGETVTSSLSESGWAWVTNGGGDSGWVPLAHLAAAAPFVRAAEAADHAELAAFDEWRHATEEAIRAGECFVAGHADAILAYAIFRRSFFARPFVATIFVHPDHRRTGLGSALIRHLESIANHRQLWISTNIENLGMQRALEKLEFRLSGVVHNLAELPELIFVKTLE